MLVSSCVKRCSLEHLTRVILEAYERNANRIQPVADEFIRDLVDIIAMTHWAEEEGATKMTLEVNW